MSDDGFSLKESMAEFGDELMGKVYPAGVYDMAVKKSTAAKTSGNKRCIRLVLEFLSGPYAGKTINEQMTWSPESDIAARIFAEGIAKMGATQAWIKDPQFGKAGPSMDQIAAKVYGAKVKVKVSEDNYQGQKRNKVNIQSTIALGSGGQVESGIGSVDLGGDDSEDLGGAEDLGGGEDILTEPEVDAKKVTVPPSEDAADLDWP